MADELLHDRGRGPELIGTRITVYNLLPYFLDPSTTEEQICRLYRLTPEQVAAARAYVLNHVEEVFAEHRRIEARIAAGNPPEVIERLKDTHERFMKFKQWVEEKQAADKTRHPTPGKPAASNGSVLPAFHQWLADQEATQSHGS